MMKNRAVCSQEIGLRNEKDRGWVFTKIGGLMLMKDGAEC